MTQFQLGEAQSAELSDLKSVAGLRFLLEVDGVGPVKARRIAEHFQNLDKLRAATEDEMRNIKLTESDIERIVSHRLNEIKKIGLPDKVWAICCFDEDWPNGLKLLKSAPAIIYVVGSLPINPSIAIVGTRNATKFGLRVVDLVSEEVAKRGWGIISGLALGIDTAAHQKALEHGAKTWAILGCGVDVPTPNRNRDLAAEIVKSGGGLISEQLPGTGPNPEHLVNRNRLQVAFSEIVVAAQAGIPSGTLHTVKFAIEQNKRLVVPRPTGKWRNEDESKANIAMTDLKGCDPEIFSASGKLKEIIQGRKPLANLVLSSTNINEIWSQSRKG